MSLSDDLIFHGIDGDECDRFVAAITQTAFQEKKLRDQAWMADMALAGMRGKALRWYSSLDEDVQLNWRLLHKALVKQYGDHTDAGLTLNPSTIPTPAAAPPLRPLSASGLSLGVPNAQPSSHADGIPQVDPTPVESLIPTSAASPLPLNSSSSTLSAMKSEREKRAESALMAAGDLENTLTSLHITSSDEPIQPLELPAIVQLPYIALPAQSSSQTLETVGKIKVMVHPNRFAGYLSRSSYSSIIGRKSNGTIGLTQSRDALLVSLMPPDKHGLCAMILRNHEKWAQYLGLKWYQTAPDISYASPHECALVYLTDNGKGDDSMSCTLSSLYWSGPTQHSIWTVDSNMALTAVYRDPTNDAVKIRLDIGLNVSDDAPQFIEMYPSLTYWRRSSDSNMAEHVKLIFVPQ